MRGRSRRCTRVAVGITSRGWGAVQSARAETTAGDGILGKLIANAQYEQAKQNGGNPDSLEPVNSQRQANGGNNSGKEPLCKMSDSDVYLVNGNWAGPNCITVNAHGKPVHPEEVRDEKSDNAQAKRA